MLSLKRIIASRLFTRYSPLLERINWNARWVKTVRESTTAPTFASPAQMYAYLNVRFFSGGTTALDFFEFGVYAGKSLRAWCALNTNAQTRFFGFDSFQGLPEDWTRQCRKGAFDVAGKLPDIEDSRVQFVAGWFQDTLPTFLGSYRPKNRLVIHNDSDLYSSTLYTLTMMNGLMVPGTIVIFDDFFDPAHEFRALSDYADAYMRRYKIVGATRLFRQAAVEFGDVKLPAK